MIDCKFRESTFKRFLPHFPPAYDSSMISEYRVVAKPPINLKVCVKLLFFYFSEKYSEFQHQGSISRRTRRKCTFCGRTRYSRIEVRRTTGEKIRSDSGLLKLMCDIIGNMMGADVV